MNKINMAAVLTSMALAPMIENAIDNRQLINFRQVSRMQVIGKKKAKARRKIAAASRRKNRAHR